MDNANSTVVSVAERVFQIVVEESEYPREMIDRSTNLSEILDSLGRIELMMACEDEFEVSIPDDEAEKIHTVGQVIDYVEARVTSPREPVSDGPTAASQ